MILPAGRPSGDAVTGCASPCRTYSFTLIKSLRFGEKNIMKKLIASLIAASFALVSFQAFAQDASAPAAPAAKPAHKHKQLKTHGKRAKVSEAASAAGTADKGAPQ